MDLRLRQPRPDDLGRGPGQRWRHAALEAGLPIGCLWGQDRAGSLDDPDKDRGSTEDLVGFRAGDYTVTRYAGNNPTNATDPSGLRTPALQGPPPGRLRPPNPLVGPPAPFGVMAPLMLRTTVSGAEK